MKKIEREAEYIASREPDKEARYYFGQIKDILNLIKAKQLPTEDSLMMRCAYSKKSAMHLI